MTTDKNRREFLGKLATRGGSSILVAAMASRFTSAEDAQKKLSGEIEKLKEAYEKLGAEKMKQEIADLRASYDRLDDRSKIIVRAVFAMGGLDIFLTL